MEIIRLCRRNAVTIRPFEELADAAQLMRQEHVGYLVVVEPTFDDNGLRPVGVLTDRDLVIKVLARDESPHSLQVGDVMTRNPIIARSTDDLGDVLPTMRRIGVRRIPVVDDRGRLAGVLSLDDVIDALAGELSDVAGSILTEQRTEEVLRP